MLASTRIIAAIAGSLLLLSALMIYPSGTDHEFIADLVIQMTLFTISLFLFLVAIIGR